MKEYFLSVICGAILCAIVTALLEKKGTSGVVLKLICGIFLTFTVIRPISTVELQDFTFFTSEISEEAAYASNIGQQHTQETIAAIIKQETEAYILDKAKALGASITAEVTLDDDLLPEMVLLAGHLTSYERHQLSQMMETELGIAKEDQIWNESQNF